MSRNIMFTDRQGVSCFVMQNKYTRVKRHVMLMKNHRRNVPFCFLYKVKS